MIQFYLYIGGLQMSLRWIWRLLRAIGENGNSVCNTVALFFRNSDGAKGSISGYSRPSLIVWTSYVMHYTRDKYGI